MNSNPDFRQIWQQQPPAAPELSVFLDYARAYRRKQAQKRWKANAMLLATVIFIGYIVSKIRPLEWLALSGSMLVMFAIVLFLALYNRMFAALGKADLKSTNQEYLKQLLVYQQRQKFLSREGISAYYILLSTGLALYMLPFLRRMPLVVAILAVALTGGWMMLGWFYFRPRTQRKEAAALQEVIAKCEDLNRQWEKPEPTA